MNEKNRPYLYLVLTQALVLTLLLTGTVWAFTRSSNDFTVFYSAWTLVLKGSGNEIYTHSPDRYLYAPGFAWLFCPIALLPQKVALFFWCLLKSLCAFGSIALISKTLQKTNDTWTAYLVGCLSLLFIARPLLIDFQYGQVNLFILFVSLWALLSLFDSPKNKVSARFFQKLVPWFCLTLVSITKLYSLPLLILPFLAPRNVFRFEKGGVLLGAYFFISLPALTEGSHGLSSLYAAWINALWEKGFPVESHNQSMSAFFYRFFSGEPSHVIALGSEWQHYGGSYFSKNTLSLIGTVWTVLGSSWLFYWLVRGSRENPLRWVSITLGSLLLPSYLIWKPYFVMLFPLAAVALASLTSHKIKSWNKGGFLFLCFVLMNLSGFDFAGFPLAGRLESASVFLWVLLGMLVYVLIECRQRTQTPP